MLIHLLLTLLLLLLLLLLRSFCFSGWLCEAGVATCRRLDAADQR